MNKVSGGHRHATRSLAFAVAMGYATTLLTTHFRYGWWAALFILVDGDPSTWITRITAG